MLLQTGLRVLFLVVAPAIFILNIGGGPSQRPRLSSIEPHVAAPGEIVMAHGANLDRSRVAELILQGNERAPMVQIVEQRPDLIRFRVPRLLDPGQYRIVLVADTRWGTEMIDQDVVLTVVKAD